MPLPGQLKNTMTIILVIIAVAALGAAIQEHFFSEKALEIKRLKQQIEQNDQQIIAFKEAYIQIDQNLKQSYEETAKLKIKLASFEQNLQNDEEQIGDIKSQVHDFATAVDIIEQYAIDNVNSSRDVLALFSPRPDR